MRSQVCIGCVYQGSNGEVCDTCWEGEKRKEILKFETEGEWRLWVVRELMRISEAINEMKKEI